ncbi:MAG: hypothetical protein ACD_79C00418G0003 [uncultured bacterium]|nr:MAG: hypothetical protein ACD_79C00418G0003 [uncultured bacterium]
MSIKTLVVDDSVAYRKILSEVLKAFNEIELTGTAPNGKIALDKIAMHSPNLVLLDVFMPEMDGIETLSEIRKKYPSIYVVMISGQTTRNADITVQALEMGAIDFIMKPKGQDPNENFEQLKKDFIPILKLIKIKLNISFIKPLGEKPVGMPVVSAPHIPPPHLKRIVPAVFSLLAIGSSTGGPEALGKVIPFLPANLPVPVVIVQHMPPVFTKFLAESLNKKSQVNVLEAEEGMELTVGKVYLAPGGHHMIIRQEGQKKIICLNDNPPENSCRPAVDVLFRSIANTYGNNGILSVVLTGMGQDGLNGVRTLKRHNCYCITQSSSTCVVYGMPRAVDEAGLSDKSLPVDQIPVFIQSILKGEIK